MIVDDDDDHDDHDDHHDRHHLHRPNAHWESGQTAGSCRVIVSIFSIIIIVVVVVMFCHSWALHVNYFIYPLLLQLYIVDALNHGQISVQYILHDEGIIFSLSFWSFQHGKHGSPLSSC